MIRLFLMKKLLGIGGNFGGICWVVCSFRQWRGYGCVWYVGETERIRVSLSSQEDTAQFETVFGMTNLFFSSNQRCGITGMLKSKWFSLFLQHIVKLQVLRNCPPKKNPWLHRMFAPCSSHQRRLFADADTVVVGRVGRQSKLFFSSRIWTNTFFWLW